METRENLIEPLLERAEEYSRTSLELLRLKALDKTADIASSFFSRILFVVVMSFFALALNMAVALWLGELLGKNYYGFVVVAFFYAVVGLILHFSHRKIKSKISNSIITQMLN